MRWVALLVGVPLLLVAFGALTWAYVLYPDPHDPKSLRYVLWKHDLASMNLDIATANIEEDSAGKNALIIGKSPQQLRERFGFLLTPHQAGPVLEQCIRNSWADGRNPLYIRHTNMVVAFRNGVAAQTGILKPC